MPRHGGWLTTTHLRVDAHCQGAHPRIVMAILGHRQIDVTLALYAHVSAPMQAEAAAKMDAALA